MEVILCVQLQQTTNTFDFKIRQYLRVGSMTCFRFMLSLFMCMKVCAVYLPHSSTQLTWVSCKFAPSVLFIFVDLKLLRAGSIVFCPGVPEIFQISKNFSHTSNPISCVAITVFVHIKFQLLLFYYTPSYTTSKSCEKISISLLFKYVLLSASNRRRHGRGKST